MVEWELMSFYNVSWTMVFFFDPYSILFSLVIVIISFSISVYSLEYMQVEKEKNLFFLILFFFVIRMLVLIFSFSISCIFLGWDGLGVTSFYLITYYHNKKRLNSSLITMYTNRLGDCCIIVIFGLRVDWLTWNLFFLGQESCLILSFFLILTALTKRAQLPFSFWLPKAMAAPTPVSSLVHSSTLVTAGLYLIFRHHNLINLVPSRSVLWILSFSTMVVGGVLALCRFDCKEIVAFSTLRQIGFIIFTLSIGLKKLAFFHLITHALFKSVLFMVRGALIHIYHSQDIRLLGLKKIPFTLSLPFLISLISMRGLPFLSGFYSKDAILDSIIFFSSGWVIDLVAILIIGLSSLYSFRILSFILLNKIFPSFWNLEFIRLSILVLVFFSIFFGSLFQWIMLNEFSFHTPTFKFLILFIVLIIVSSPSIDLKIKFFWIKYIERFNFHFIKNFSFLWAIYPIIELGWLKLTFFYLNFITTLSTMVSKIWIKFVFILFIILIWTTFF